jgi:hypothetical protein
VEIMDAVKLAVDVGALGFVAIFSLVSLKKTIDEHTRVLTAIAAKLGVFKSE